MKTVLLMYFHIWVFQYDFAVERSTELKEKKKLVDKICLPFVSVFPKKRKDGEHNLEGQTAGLASMETLDSDKNVNKNDDVRSAENIAILRILMFPFSVESRREGAT